MAQVLSILQQPPVVVLVSAVVAVGSAIVIITLLLDSLRSRKRIIPGPKPHPLLGNAVEILRNYHRFLDFMLDLQKVHGNTYGLRIPFQPAMVATTNVKNIEYVLKTNFENFVKGPHFYEIQDPLLGHGIFNSDGHQWRVQRKTASHIFNVKNFREYMGVVFEERINTLCDVLRTAAESESIVDIQDLFFRLTLDSFSEIGFGTKLGALTAPGPIAFAAAFDRAQGIIDERFLTSKPLWVYGEPLNGKRRELKKCIEIMDDFAYEMISERRKDSNSGDYSDLLSRFINLKDADGNNYTDKELRDIILNFIIAGRDTTAQALSWSIYLLCQHPHVVEKFVVEINRVTPNEYPSYDAVKELKYGYHVFGEALRLYPSVPKNMKMAVSDCVLPDGTKIYQGDAVCWSPYVMARLPEIWGEDAAEYKPERWENMGNPGQFEYPVFHGGPRLCLGQSMAQFEAVSCLAAILREFKFELVDNPKDITYAAALTLPTGK